MSTPFRVAGPAGTLVAHEFEGGGDALPALLVHGINMGADVWHDVAERLSTERRVVTLDLRGHGESDKVGPFSAADYADDCLAVLDHRSIYRAHVVGTSFGGSVACELAARAPDRVASVASIGGTLRIEGIDVDGAVAVLHAAGPEAFFAGFMPQASFAPGVDDALIARAIAVATTGRDAQLIEAVSRAAFGDDVTAAAGRVKCPSLVMAGALDATCPTPLGEQMAKTLGTELVQIDGRGHVVVMEDPEAVVAVLRGHLTAADA